MDPIHTAYVVFVEPSVLHIARAISYLQIRVRIVECVSIDVIHFFVFVFPGETVQVAMQLEPSAPAIILCVYKFFVFGFTGVPHM